MRGYILKIASFHRNNVLLQPMKISIYLFLAVMIASSCKSEFEMIRSSNDPARMYKQALKYYEAEDWVKAQTLLELSIPNYRGKEEAEDLYFKYANTYYQVGEYILGAHYFKSFANTFYNSDKKQEAEFLSAYSNYKLSPNSKLDQTYTAKAIEEFQRFVNTYPRSERVADCNNLIDEMRAKLEKKAFGQGKLYYEIGQYQSAVKSFGNLLSQFPETDRSEEVRFLMLKSSYELAQKSIYEKKRKRYSETLKLYKKFNKKHKASDHAKEALEIFQNTENELKKLKV